MGTETDRLPVGSIWRYDPLDINHILIFPGLKKGDHVVVIGHQLGMAIVARIDKINLYRVKIDSLVKEEDGVWWT